MLDRPCSQEVAAELLGVHRSVVGDLLRRGVLKPGDTAQVWVRSYFDHLRAEASRRTTGTLAESASALKNAQRAEVELRLSTRRREFAPVHLVDQVLALAGRRCADLLAGLPAAIRLRWPGATADQLELIAAEVERARAVMAGARIAVLANEADEAEGD